MPYLNGRLVQALLQQAMPNRNALNTVCRESTSPNNTIASQGSILFQAVSMGPSSMRLAFLGLLLSLHCVHGMQCLAVDDILSAAGGFEPAPVPAEPAAFHGDETVELCFKETAVCPDYFIDYGDVGSIDDDHLVTEFACPSLKKKSNKLFTPMELPTAGLCVLNNEDQRSDEPGVSTPSTDQLAFDFQFSATCYIKQTPSDECHLKGLENYILDIHGAVIKSETIVIDREPRAAQPPIRCAGKNLEDNCIDPSSPTCIDSNRRAKTTPKQRKLGRDNVRNSTRLPTQQTSPAKRQPTDRQTNGEQTFWEGPAKIWTGVVYAHPRRPGGRLQIGHFQYVRPEHIFGDDCGCFTEITESQLAGRRVYTPFEYVIQLSTNREERQSA